MKTWAMTTLREKLIKIGAKVVRHAKYVTFQMAEVAVPCRLYRAILERIRRLAALSPRAALGCGGTPVATPNHRRAAGTAKCPPHPPRGTEGPSKLPFFATPRVFGPVAGRKSACGASNSTGGGVLWCSNGPAAESGEGYLGNAGRKERVHDAAQVPCEELYVD